MHLCSMLRICPCYGVHLQSGCVLFVTHKLMSCAAAGVVAAAAAAVNFLTVVLKLQIGLLPSRQVA